jgi:hypothetical protein
MLDIEYTSDSDDPISQIILGALKNNPAAARRGLDAINKVIRRAVGRTLSNLRRDMANAIRTNEFGLEPLSRYSASGGVISPTIRAYVGSFTQNYVPQSKYLKFGSTRRKKMEKSGSSLMAYKQQKHKQKDYAPGRGFARAITYWLSDTEIQGKVGLMTSSEGGRAKPYWMQAFSEFQEAGELNLLYSSSVGQGRGLRGFMGAIGMPIKKSKLLKRPARPIMDKAEAKYRTWVLEELDRNLAERLANL